MRQIYRCFGGWSWAFFPYWVHNTPAYIDNPKFTDMVQMIDPYGKKALIIHRRIIPQFMLENHATI